MGIGKRIRKLRRDKDLTQEYVAELAGVTPAYISKLENDGTDPDTDLLARLAKAIGVRIVDFFEDDKPGRVRNAGEAQYPEGVFFSMPGSISEEQKEQIRWIVEALAKLDSDDKEAILKVIQGMSKKRH
jgi:transcriptional regulator with XRE-family HTH domain